MLTVIDQPRYGKRTTASGLQLTFGNASGIMAPFLYPTKEGPRYFRGHGVSLAMAGLAGIVYSIMSLYFRARNERRAAGREDEQVAGLSEEEVAELGDESPRFVYTY